MKEKISSHQEVNKRDELEKKLSLLKLVLAKLRQSEAPDLKKIKEAEKEIEDMEKIINKQEQEEKAAEAILALLHEPTEEEKAAEALLALSGEPTEEEKAAEVLLALSDAAGLTIEETEAMKTELLGGRSEQEIADEILGLSSDEEIKNAEEDISKLDIKDEDLVEDDLIEIQDGKCSQCGHENSGHYIECYKYEGGEDENIWADEMLRVLEELRQSEKFASEDEKKIIQNRIKNINKRLEERHSAFENHFLNMYQKGSSGAGGIDNPKKVNQFGGPIKPIFGPERKKGGEALPDNLKKYVFNITFRLESIYVFATHGGANSLSSVVKETEVSPKHIFELFSQGVKKTLTDNVSGLWSKEERKHLGAIINSLKKIFSEELKKPYRNYDSNVNLTKEEKIKTIKYIIKTVDTWLAPKIKQEHKHDIEVMRGLLKVLFVSND